MLRAVTALGAVALLAGCGEGRTSAPASAAPSSSAQSSAAPAAGGATVGSAPAATAAPANGNNATSAPSKATSALPQVEVFDVGDGSRLDLASLAPSDRPILLWMWAPY